MAIPEEFAARAAPGFFAAIVRWLGRLRSSAVRVTLRNGMPYELTHPMGTTGLCHRTWRLEVENRGHEKLECLAKLMSMTQAGDSKYQNAFLPIGLITQHQAGEQRTGGPFNLRPGESKLVEVASLDEAVDGSDIRLHYETSGYPCHIPRARYKLKISILGGHKPRDIECDLYVDGAGRLRLRAAA